MNIHLPYTKKILPSGLRIIFHPKKSPIVAVNLWAKVGVKDEDPEKVGISHFFEHMVFKGTTLHPGLELTRQVQALGGTINAGTSFDTTDYYIVAPVEEWKKALNLIIELVSNPLFDSGDIEQEKSVIIREIHLENDDPEEKLTLTFYKEIFSGTPYERSILGTESTVGQINREDFIRHQEIFYHPSNLILTICGDISENQLLDEIDRYYGKPSPTLNSPSRFFPVLHQPIGHRKQINMDIHHHYGAIGFIGPGMKHRDSILLNFLSIILGEGIGSRLNTRLRESEKLVDTVLTHYSNYQEGGIFSIIYTFAKGNPQRIEAVIHDELDQLRTHPPQEKEMIRARNLFLTSLYNSIETTLGSAELLGRLEAIHSIDTFFQRLSIIHQVQPDQVLEVCEKYLDFDHAVGVLIKPEGY